MAFSSAFRGILGGHLMPSSIFQSQCASLRFCSTLTTSKLFVSGLSRYTSDEGLNKAFEQFGKLVEAKVITDMSKSQFNATVPKKRPASFAPKKISVICSMQLAPKWIITQIQSMTSMIQQ